MPPSKSGGRSGSDSGYVTAETATVIPVLVLFMAVLVGGLAAAAAQIQCVDAARAGARAAARAEPRRVVIGMAREAAPRDAKVSTFRDGPMVRVEVTARALGPGRFGQLLSVNVGASAVAYDEDQLGAVP